MALGTFGSTLNDELNRLANGGTYRTMASMVDEALAAKQWANRENINPYSTDTVGILNEIAGLGTDKRNWLDFNGVCNYIAGTTGLPAAAALRQVYNTTDLLTSQSAYYIDATDASASGQTVTNLGTAGSLLPTTVGSSTSADSNDPIFLSHTGTNYVYCSGSNGSYLSVPDESALDITGDIDLRWYGALDDWTPAGNGALIDKRATGTTEISYGLRIATTGRIVFTYSTDGITMLTVSSTVSPTVADGANLWVRALVDVDNGAGGFDVTFYTSNDGTNWTQLGTTVTTAGTITIYSGTGTLYSGASTLGSYFYTGKCYRYQIFAGLTGTDKRLDVDTSVITAGSATSFTAVTGQTVTINRPTSGRKTVAVTQPTWLFGTDDYMEVNNRYMSSGTYLYLPGITLNYAFAADAAPLDITGDIDLRAKVALDDWTPSAANTLIAKGTSASGQRSYHLTVDTTGTLSLVTSPDGTTANSITYTSTVAPTITDGATKWVRATLDVDNGASGKTATFYTSDDGSTWTQLGNVVTTAGTTSIYSGTSPLYVGGLGSAAPARGKFFRAQVYNGIAGTLAFDANFETSITSLLQSTFTESSANAATVTINRSGTSYQSVGITAAGYLYPGATNTFAASATDFLNFGASDSFTVVAAVRKFATFSTFRGIVSKMRGVNDGYYLTNNTADTNLAFVIDSAGQLGSAGLTSGLPNGELNVISGVVDRASQTLTTYSDSLTPAVDTDISNVGTLTYNDTTLQIARRGGGSVYADIEVYATAVFRQALTAAQIRQISNYFANREVYL